MGTVINASLLSVTESETMKNKSLTLIATALLLSGCTVQRMNEVRKDAEDTGIKTSSLIKQMGDNYPVVQFQNSQYVNTSPLPKPKYDGPREIVNCQVTYKTVKSVDIFQFAQDITDQCGVRVRVTPDAATYVAGGSSVGAGTPTQQLSSVPSPVLGGDGMRPLSTFGSGTPMVQSNVVSGVARTISNVSYSGKLGGLLDLVAGRLGISKRYDENGNIVFYYLETKRFDIEPADAKYALKGSVSSGLSNATGTDSSTGSNSGVSGSGGSTMSSTVDMGNALYSDLQKTVESMLTPGVGRFSLNSTTGTLMVTDVPDVIARVGEYIEDENSSLSRQVVLKVVTYTIDSDITDSINIDWNLVWKSLSGNYGINLANTTSNVPTDAISGGFNVLDTATGSAAQFAGSSFLADVLSKQVNISNVKTNTFLTTNMAAAPILIGQQVTYLKKVTTTPYSTGNTTTLQQSLEPGSVTTGTNITIFPKVLKGGDRLMLNMFMDISSLKQLRTIKNETEKMEAPDIDTRSSQQRIWLKPGQTIVMSGFEQDENNSMAQGVGSPDNILFGGGKSGSKTKQSFVITVTPYVR